jgi:hypothetical protein
LRFASQSEHRRADLAWKTTDFIVYLFLFAHALWRMEFRLAFLLSKLEQLSDVLNGLHYLRLNGVDSLHLSMTSGLDWSSHLI